MDSVLNTILGALAAGAVAKAKDVASQGVMDAYNGLKSLIIRKLDGDDTGVSVVEKKPESENAHAVLAEALTDKHLQTDVELQQYAEQLKKALVDAKAAGMAGTGDIEIDRIQGHVNAIVDDLVATGRVKIGSIIGVTGDARITRIRAGTQKK